ncbi:MAG: CoA ester lyase [Euryarchaeota archaeon]|nr:CoA ester lyase [Euryarchaeota archaeon]
MDHRPLRSVLFTPATRADRWLKALEGPADVAVIDLEDAVAPADKETARRSVADALKSTRAGKTLRGVRMNSWTSRWAKDDLEAIAPLRPDLVVLPKVESGDDVIGADLLLTERGCDAELLLIIETARGVMAASAIASASPRVRAVAFGAEDYAASVGARRTVDGLEVLYARSHVVASAAAADVDAIDQVFVDFKDAAGLERDTRFGAQLGFTGKQVIHPDQVPTVHRAFRPSAGEVAWAKKVLDAVRSAGTGQGGVVAVDGRMIDPPLIRQAERVIALSVLDAP